MLVRKDHKRTAKIELELILLCPIELKQMSM
jgi:hypothetical protein